MITRFLQTCGIIVMAFPPTTNAVPEQSTDPYVQPAQAVVAAAAGAEEIVAQGVQPAAVQADTTTTGTNGVTTNVDMPDEIPNAILREIEQIRSMVNDSPISGSILDDGDDRLVPRADAAPAGSNLPPQYQQHAVRSIMRRLDAITADLDELGLPAEATHLRRVNESLRQQIRRGNSGS